MIKLSLPYIPPSSNQMYSSVRGRLIKSKAAREFDDKIDFYALTSKRKLEATKAKIKQLFDDGFKTLRIDCCFVFYKNKVIGQKGQIKRIDASNRLKQTHDSLSRLIGIDDSLFSEGSFAKIICNDIKDEQILITITGANIERFEDI